MAVNHAVARRLGLPPVDLNTMAPALDYSKAIDIGLSPRLKALPRLPLPTDEGYSGTRLPGGMNAVHR